MRILHVDHAGVLGGAERSVLELARAQRLRGHEPILAVGQSGPFLAAAHRDEFVTIDMSWPDHYVRAPASSSPWRTLGRVSDLRHATRALTRTIAHARPDIVHVHTRKSHIVSAVATGTTVPTLFHLRDAMPQRRILRAAIRASVRRAHHAVALSPWLIEDYSVAGALPRSGRVGLVPSGVQQSGLRGLRTPWLEGEPVMRIGYVGQIAAWKAPHLLVDAAELLPATPGVSFHIIGDVLFADAEEGYGAWLEERISRSRSRANITWHHATDTPEEAMSMLDILVHTSISPEPFGRVLVEAMAARRPVVAFRLGSAPEVLGRDWPYFASSADGVGIASALVALTGDRSTAAAMARVAEERAARFSPEVIAELMDHEYRWLSE